MDVDARMQLFDLKKTYQFTTVPGVDKYNMPLFNEQIQAGGQIIKPFPVYQGFTGNVTVRGVPVSFSTRRDEFYSFYPNIYQSYPRIIEGDGSNGPYTFQLPILSNTTPPQPPINGIIRGHVDMSGIIATGQNVDPIVGPIPNLNVPVTSTFAAFFISSLDADNAPVSVTDSGQFLDANQNCGMLIQSGKAPYGNQILAGGYSTTNNIVNYLTGEVYVTFPVAIPAGMPINVQCLWFQSGLPRSVLFYNNTLTFRSPPDNAYVVELDAYQTPVAFLASSDSVPFGYMTEYIARGAARKILSDTGDWEQFDRYEPLFREQESLVWKRSQRQFTSTRTQTIYSQGSPFNNMGFGTGYGGTN